MNPSSCHRHFFMEWFIGQYSATQAREYKTHLCLFFPNYRIYMSHYCPLIYMYRYLLSSAKSLILLYHVWHIIYTQKKQTVSQHRTLWHTRHDRAGVRLLAFKHNSGSAWKKGPNPGDNIVIYAKTMALQQEPFMIFYLIKGLAEVHCNNQCFR